MQPNKGFYKALEYVGDQAQYAFFDPTHDNDALWRVNGKDVGDVIDGHVDPDISAFYIGKVFKEKILQILRQSVLYGIGIEADHKIYNGRFIRVTLHNAFRFSNPGEKVRVVVGSTLSTLFNGPHDVEDAFSEEEEMREIYGVAAKEFNDRYNNLEIVRMQDMPGNKRLFECLHQHIKPDGTVDVHAAYDNGLPKNTPPQLSENPDALEIAQYLYWACKHNGRLRKRFFDLRSKKVKEGNYPESSKFYGLTEIAIRLSDILRGTYVQGGADRQEFYDRIIWGIILGEDKENESFKNIEVLKPLFKIFKDKKHVAIYTNSKWNYYEHKWQKKLIKGRALSTLFVLLTMTYIGTHIYATLSDDSYEDNILRVDDGDFEAPQAPILE